MPETWIYVIGGIIVGVIAFVIAYNLISSSLEYSQRQNTLGQFSSFYSDVDTVCLQELNNALVRKFSIPSSIRVVYVTNDTDKILPKVVDQIKNEQLAVGQSICLQFKNENYLRCYPEPPSRLLCDVKMPYMGALPESEDIWMKVSKILGRSPTREYNICIKKIGGESVNITFDAENCLKIGTTTTTIPEATTTTIQMNVYMMELYIRKPNGEEIKVRECISNIANFECNQTYSTCFESGQYYTKGITYYNSSILSETEWKPAYNC